MTQIFRLIVSVSWVLGLLSMLLAVIIKVANLSGKLSVAPHTGFVVASAFFLCALATREMRQE